MKNPAAKNPEIRGMMVIARREVLDDEVSEPNVGLFVVKAISRKSVNPSERAHEQEKHCLVLLQKVRHSGQNDFFEKLYRGFNRGHLHFDSGAKSFTPYLRCCGKIFSKWEASRQGKKGSEPYDGDNQNQKAGLLIC